MEMINELGVNQSTIYFKVNLLKILEKYPKLKKSQNDKKKYVKEVKKSLNSFTIVELR